MADVVCGFCKGSWTEIGEKSVPLYNIPMFNQKMAKWFPSIGTPCINFANSDEHGFGRPFVRKVNSHCDDPFCSNIFTWLLSIAGVF